MHPEQEQRPRPESQRPASDEIAAALEAELGPIRNAAPLAAAEAETAAEGTRPALLATPSANLEQVGPADLHPIASTERRPQNPDVQRPRSHEAPLDHSLLAPADAPPAMVAPSGDRYRLEGSLGRGGMGHVYAARDSLLGRQVALKRVLLPPGSEAAAFEARLLEEARALAAIRHPHVVQLYDLGKDAQGHYLVMELLEGGSLERRLDLGPLDEASAIDLGIQMCEALEAIHGQCVVHRDIKPANILFDAEGTPKLGDFGLARSQAGLGLTRQGSAMGTLAYMAPEQARDAAAVDARADVYGLGATLYHALTGQSPRMMRESKLPPRLRGVLLKALEEEPERRFGDARAMREALQAVRGTRLATPQGAATVAPSPAELRPPQARQLDALTMIDGLLAEAQPAEALWLSLVWGELQPEWRAALTPRIQRARAAALQEYSKCGGCGMRGPRNLLLDGCCEGCQLRKARELATRLRDPQACLAELRRLREQDGAAAAYLEALICLRLRPELRASLEPELAALRAESHPYQVNCGQCGARTGSNLTNFIRGRVCCPDCTQRLVLAGRVIHRPRKAPSQQSGADAAIALLIAIFMALMLLVQLIKSMRKDVLEDQDPQR